MAGLIVDVFALQVAGDVSDVGFVFSNMSRELLEILFFLVLSAIAAASSDNKPASPHSEGPAKSGKNPGAERDAHT